MMRRVSGERDDTMPVKGGPDEDSKKNVRARRRAGEWRRVGGEAQSFAYLRADGMRNKKGFPTLFDSPFSLSSISKISVADATARKYLWSSNLL